MLAHMTAEAPGYGPAEVAETHSGIVFFVGDRAYKLKKAVDLGFLDFTTREARAAACHREVELNGRLSPDVYLGVADIVDPSGQVADHLVVMRRMPPDRRLSDLVGTDAELDSELDDLARLIAEFHASAERSPEADRAASATALATRWSTNTSEMQPFVGRYLDAEAVKQVDTLAHRYLDGRHRLFERRIAAGRACDGHGDLLADDIFLLDDGPRVLDCLEFDDALRLDDALADVAFLAMDLQRLGRPELASQFLDAYRRHSTDSWPESLAHHHIAYRAQVRAKVAAIRADQGVPGSAPKAAELLDLALAHLEAARVRLVLVGGLPGTGKSTLAAGLGDALGAAVLRSDVVRKELAGLAPDEPAPAPVGKGIYQAETTTATYGELADRARQALGLGETVVLDASWTSEEHRATARRVAEETSSELVELRCTVAPEVQRSRLLARAERGADASDADATVAAHLQADADPWPSATVIDTDRPTDATLAAALDVIREQAGG